MNFFLKKLLSLKYKDNVSYMPASIHINAKDLDLKAIESIREIFGNANLEIRPISSDDSPVILSDNECWALIDLLDWQYEDEDDEKVLRGRNVFGISLKNYEGDDYTYYLYTITPKQLGKTEKVIKKIQNAGLKVHMQLLSNDEGVDGFNWSLEELQEIREEMDEMLDKFPDTVISSKYYHKIITTGEMLDRPFGWEECPSVTLPLDNRQNNPKRLINFIRWASDLKTMHRCCTSETRDC